MVAWFRFQTSLVSYPLEAGKAFKAQFHLPLCKRRTQTRFQNVMTKLLPKCFYVLLAITGWATAARGEWRIAGHIGGSTSAIAVQGNFAYVGLGSRLHIYDISNPALPVERSSTRGLGDFISDVAILEARAYVTAGTDGLFVFDISIPASPREIGRWNSPGSAEGVAVSASTAYVADGPFGLQILDVSNPSAPAVVATAFDGQFAFDVVVSGRYAFVAAAGAGLLIADVSAPAKPRELATLDTPGYARDIALSGTILYLADEWGGMRIIDITDPLRPREVSAIPLQSWAFAAAVSGTTLYVAAGSEGMHLFDVSDPSRPQRLGIYDMPWQVSWKIAVAGNHAVLGMRGLGVHIFDVRNPARPQITGKISPLIGVQAVSVRENLAFLMTESQGMRIVDVSNPAQPRPRGGGSEEWGWTVLATENRVYACQGRNPNPVIQVFDVSNPDEPRPVASRRIARGYCRDIVLKGTILYVPDEFGLEIFDVSNPDEPTRVADIILPGAGGADQTTHAIGVDVFGTTAFVGSGDSGVQVVDVADPRNLRIIGAWSQTNPPVQVKDVFFHDGRLYLTCGIPFPQLIILDVRNPARPVLLGAASIPGQGKRVVVRGSTAYVAVGASGVAVLDVRNPAAPVLTSRVAVPGFTRDIDFAGDRLVAVSTEGLFVLEQDTSLPAMTMYSSDSERGLKPATTSQIQRYDRPVVAGFSPRSAGAAGTGRTIVVSSTADSGTGTLRDAMNNLAAGDIITFDPTVFPPTAPVEIRLERVLPRITRDGITIDGSNAGVILDGSRLTGQFEPGISINSVGNTIRGLQILNFPWSGIVVSGNGGNLIQGNVVSRNREAGIQISNPNGNVVIGNRVGTDATGRIGLGRQQTGVLIFQNPGDGEVPGPDRIGGDEAWEANVISGNVGAEIYLHRARGHLITGNFLGTDPTGTVRVGSAFNAIGSSFAAGNVITRNVMIAEQWAVLIIDSGSCCNRIANNWIGVTRNGVPLATPAWTIGVTVFESFNLVANNMIHYGYGVSVTGGESGITDTIVIGNKMAAGARADRDGEAAIQVYSASRTFIGGPAAGERNEITGKLLGIWLQGSGVDRTFMLGNTISGNAGAVDLGSAALSFVQGNLIANNRTAGVSVSTATNRIRRNSIHDNGSGGISMTAEATGLPPRPVVLTANTMSITGTACAQCTVDIYSDSGMQGRWYEGTTVADPDGRFTLAKNGVIQGANITATATDRSGSTSAFSISVPARLSVAARGGLSSVTSGSGSSITVGYGSLKTESSAPRLSGMAIFGYREGNVLVSEASVPASTPITSGRIYAEIAGAVHTGLAIANPNSQSVNVTFYFTNSSGQNFGAGSIVIPAGGQIARFLNQDPFNGRSPLTGSFTFTASAPVAAVALRGLINERSEFLITTLSVADLAATASTSAIVFPHFADGGGWSTQIVIVNPSDSEIRLTVQFSSLVVVDGQTGSSFPVTIPPGSSRRLGTAGQAASTQSGSVRLTPEGGSRTPSAVAIFSFRNAGVTVSEAGVPGVAPAAAFRLYAESSGEFSAGEIGSIQTGFAISNPSASPITVNFELTTLPGTPLGLAGSATIPANGHIARFLDQVDGFRALPTPFQGILRATTTSASGISIVGLRARHNERGDFLITTTQPVAENAAPAVTEFFFPHFADGGGYTTQFVVFNISESAASSGQFRFLSQSGELLTLTLR